MKHLYLFLTAFFMITIGGNAQKLELPESATFHLPTNSFLYFEMLEARILSNKTQKEHKRYLLISDAPMPWHYHL